MRLALPLALGLVLTGCGTVQNVASRIPNPFAGGLRGAATEVDGIRFRTRVRADRADPRLFTAATRSAGRAPTAADEAGRAQAAAYCIERFGGSEIVWAAGSAEGAGIALTDGGALVLTGRCVSR